MLDLLCCASRSRASSSRGSLFPADRRLGSRGVLAGADGAAQRQSVAAHEKATFPAPRTELNGSASHEKDVACNSAEPASLQKKSDEPTPPNGHGAVADHRSDEDSPKPWARRGANAPGTLSDPFLINSAADVSEEAAALARLQLLAVQIRGQVRVRQQPPSKSHGSLLPPGAPGTLHMELVPGSRGTGVEAWVASEIAIWDSEKAVAEAHPRLASVRLLRVTKVRHLDKHDGGCSMRLRTQQADSHEVCEEILVHASEGHAKACSEALVEAINLVRALVGRSVHAPVNEY